jgi:hypothetical protein
MFLVSSIIFPVIFIENDPLIINLLYIGEEGDLGSPVFDENGILWGFYMGIMKFIKHVPLCPSVKF